MKNWRRFLMAAAALGAVAGPAGFLAAGSANATTTVTDCSGTTYASTGCQVLVSSGSVATGATITVQVKSGFKLGTTVTVTVNGTTHTYTEAALASGVSLTMPSTPGTYAVTASGTYAQTTSDTLEISATVTVTAPSTPTTTSSTTTTTTTTVPATTTTITTSSGAKVVTTSSKSSTTVITKSGGASADITIPAGALPAGTKVTVAPVQNTASLASAISASTSTKTAAYVAAFSVTWVAPNNTTPTATKPVTMTVSDPAIKPGDVIYELVNGKLKKVGVATTAGTANITFTGDPVFLVMAPPRIALANAFLLKHPRALGVRVACTSGSICQGIGYLNVARRVNGKLRQMHVGVARFSVRQGAAATVNFGLTKFGNSLLGARKANQRFRLGMVLRLNTGARLVHLVYIR